MEQAAQPTESPAVSRRISIGTWNMDHWKRTPQQRRDAWSFLQSGSGADVMLLQESVVPSGMSRSRIVHREIGGSRAWGSAVVALDESLQLEEIDTVRSRYASTRFSMLGTYPGAVIVTRVQIPDIGPITCVSVYGVINVYSQTTMLRVVADLIPLFDSPDGKHVVLGGDFNVSDSTRADAVELPRYRAALTAIESLGLKNLAATVADRPPAPERCLCGQDMCHHLHTFGANPGIQLDWLYATPELAGRCRRIRVERDLARDLSDHAPVIADFDVPPSVSDRSWDSESIAQEIGVRNGQEVGRVAEDLIAWAQRKHEEMKSGHEHHASLDRLPTSTGSDPEIWIQLDLKRPDRLQYTFSMNAAGRVTIQFQYMTAPYNTVEARERVWGKLNDIPGVSLEKRLEGRPWFPIAALLATENREKFERIIAEIIDVTRGANPTA
jgi:endonuclease/exonuclease/phosphatase family metal-dependent hydrolase